MPDPDLPSPVAAPTGGPTPTRRPANPWATTALILGVFSQVFPYLQSLGLAGAPPLTTLITATLALLLSITGLTQARKGHRGLALSSAALTCALLTLLNWAWHLLAALALRNWTF